MRLLRILFFHELRSLAFAAPTCVAAVVFLSLMGWIYHLALADAVGVSHADTPVQTYFRAFAVPLLFIVPLLTMRSFAEERRLGTLGALFSTPVHAAQVVVAKFAAVYAFYLLLWAGALLFPLVAWGMLGGLYGDERLLSLPSLLGGAVFVSVSGLLYVAAGIFASALTRSTLVAALLTFCALFVLVVFGRVLQQVPTGGYASVERLLASAEYLDTFHHLDVFLRGIVDTRPLFLFGSGALAMLGLATLAVGARV
ncbi:MAG: ABC transporter permease subunit [Puniceicoccales bacterium]|jgi:ABC-2 type transport system permease protein|nr:ABC transporter permease subunit [Puniceicoccales bacterium]